jgi:hypothetical protein
MLTFHVVTGRPKFGTSLNSPYQVYLPETDNYMRSQLEILERRFLWLGSDVTGRRRLAEFWCWSLALSREGSYHRSSIEGLVNLGNCRHVAAL